MKVEVCFCRSRRNLRMTVRQNKKQMDEFDVAVVVVDFFSRGALPPCGERVAGRGGRWADAKLLRH